ncbi:mucin-16-like [Saccopteryx bilineata]|uniref:mucin-16-like n=1 Tax=Saccopteryx bilineata TaxID=59482 RepID=UPI00338FE07C
METTISTPVPSSSDTTGFETESASSTTTGMRETSMSQSLGTKETITSFYIVSPEGGTDIPGIENSSSKRTSFSVPASSTVTPDMPKAAATLPTSSTRTEPVDRPCTMPTGPFTPTSRGTPMLDPSTTASFPATPSAVTPTLTHTEVTSFMNTGAKYVSRTSPSLVEQSSSSSSEYILDTNSPPLVSPTKPQSAPTSHSPWTSLLAQDQLTASHIFRTSSGLTTQSPPTVSDSMVVYTPATSEAFTERGATLLVTNRAVTNVGATGSGQKTYFSVPAGRSSSVSSLGVPSFIQTATTISTPVTGSSDSARFVTDSASSMTPEPREPSTPPPLGSATEKITGSSEVPPEKATNIPGTENSSSSRMFYSGPAFSTVTQDMPKTMASLSTSSTRTEPTERTVTTPTGLPGVTSQITAQLDTSAMASLPLTFLAVTPSFTHAEETTLMRRGSEDLSRTNSSLVVQSSSSSQESVLATNLPPPVSLTNPESGPTSHAPITSLLAPHQLTATDMLGTSLSSWAQSPPTVRDTTVVDTPDTSEPSVDTGTTFFATSTALTNVGTTSSRHETHSSFPPGTGPSPVSSPVVPSNIQMEATVSTLVPSSSDTTGFETESASSMTAGMRETSTSQPLGSAKETITSSSKVLSEGVTNIPRMEDSSIRTSLSRPAFSTVTSEIPTAMAWLPTSFSRTEPVERALTAPTGHSRIESQDTTPLDTSAINYGPVTPSAVISSVTETEVTSFMSRSPEYVSRTSPLSVKQSSSSSLESLPATISPPSVSPRIPESGSSSPSPITSLPATGHLTASYLLDSSLGPGALSPPTVRDSTAVDTPATSETSTDTGATTLAKNKAVTNVGTSSSGQETYSSVPTGTGPFRISSPVVPSSIQRETTVSPTVPGSSDTTGFETESALTSTSGQRETSTSQPMRSATETITSSSQVPPEGVTDIPRMEKSSSRSKFYSGSAFSTMTPDLPKPTARLPTSSTRSEPAERTLTMPTGSPGATSRNTPPLDSSTTASSLSTPLGVTPTLTHAEATSFMSTGPETVSSTSPSLLEQSSSSSQESILATSSPPTVSPRKPECGSTSSSPVTSLWAPGLLTATHMLGTSLGSLAQSPPTVRNTRVVDTPAISEVSTDTGATPFATNRVGTNVGTIRSEHNTYSSFPLDSGPSGVSFSVVLPSIQMKTSISTPVPGSSDTTGFETESASSTATRPSTFQPLGSAMETITDTSKVPSKGATYTPRIEDSSSRRTFFSVPAFSTVTPEMTSATTELSTSSTIREPAERTFTTPTATPSAFIPSFPQAEMTTLMSTGPEDVLMTSPSLVERSSSSSLESILATTSPPSVSPTKLESGLTYSSFRTSLPATGLLTTSHILGTSSGPAAQSPPTLRNSMGVDTPATSESSTERRATPLVTNRAVSNVGTTGFGQKTYFSFSVSTKPSRISSPVVPSFIQMETTTSTPVTGSSDTTGFEMESASFVSPGMRETSTSQPLASATETITDYFEMPLEKVTNFPKTEESSSSKMSYSGPATSTVTPDMPTATAWLSTSSTRTELAKGTLTTPMGQLEATSQDTTFLDISTTTSHPATSSAVTPSFTHVDVTTLMSKGSEDVSKTSPFLVEESSSPSLNHVLDTISPPSVSPRIPESGSSSPSSVTSLPATVQLTASHLLGTSLGPGAQSPPTVRDSTVVDTPATSETSTDTGATTLAKNKAVTNVGTSSSGQEIYSSVPSGTGPSRISSPVVPSSIQRETTVSPTVPGSSDTTGFETESALTSTSGQRETSTSQPMRSATETITSSSQVPPEGVTDIPRMEKSSSRSKFYSGPAFSTMTSDMPKPTARLSTSSTRSEPAERTLTMPTGSPGATSWLDSSTTASFPATPSAVTPTLTHTEVTSFMSTGAKYVSRTSPSLVEQSSSSSSEYILDKFTSFSVTHKTTECPHLPFSLDLTSGPGPADCLTHFPHKLRSYSPVTTNCE